LAAVSFDIRAATSRPSDAKNKEPAQRRPIVALPEDHVAVLPIGRKENHTQKGQNNVVKDSIHHPPEQNDVGHVKGHENRAVWKRVHAEEMEQDGEQIVLDRPVERENVGLEKNPGPRQRPAFVKPEKSKIVVREERFE